MTLTRPRSYHSSLTNLPCLNSSMVRMKVTLQKGERGGKTKVLRAKTVALMVGKERRPPPQFTSHPWLKRFHLELKRRIEEVEQLEGWGSHCHCHPPYSWPRWLQRLGHLSWVGRNLLIRSSNLPWEAKPLGGILMGRPSKEAQKIPAWDSCPPQDMAVPKEHRAPDLETPLLAASPQDSHTSRSNMTCTSRGMQLYACRKLQRHM